MSTAAAPTTRVESVLQRAELELWRDNIDGALDLLARAHTLAPDHRYAARAEEIRSWLRHLESRGAYAAAYEEYYRRSKGRLDLKRFERANPARSQDAEDRAARRRLSGIPVARARDHRAATRARARCRMRRRPDRLVSRPQVSAHPGDGRRSLGDQRRHRAASQSLPQRGVSARPRRGRGRRHGARVLRPRLLLRGARARARRRDDGGRAPAYAATGRPVLFRRPDERTDGHRPGPGASQWPAWPATSASSPRLACASGLGASRSSRSRSSPDAGGRAVPGH